MSQQVKNTVMRAEKVVRKLKRILRNVDSPCASKRKFLMYVVYSVVLYTAPIWKRVLRHTKYREINIKYKINENTVKDLA